MKRAAYVISIILLAFVALAGSGANQPITAIAQTGLPTFVDLPQGATEIYPGSGIYKTDISQPMGQAVEVRAQDNWEKFQIAKESNLGLPLGSMYLQAQNGKYVELALYERAAFTAFQGNPVPQILSAVLSTGKIQVSEAEFIKLPDTVRQGFSGLPIAGEGGLDTPSVARMAVLQSADKSKAVDADWSAAEKMLGSDGTLDALDPTLGVTPLQLGEPDGTTGHRVPDLISTGLSKLFGEQVLGNAGLPLSPAVWIEAKINGVLAPVCVQVFERMVVTYNPDNDEANRVQVGLGGAIVWQGLANAIQPMPTPTVTSEATAIPSGATPVPQRVEKVPGKEWFGGYDNRWRLSDGSAIGWGIPEKGKQDLETNLMLMLITQGRYGNSVDSVETHLRQDPIIDFDGPIYDSSIPQNYHQRSPSLVTSKPEKWNTSLPMIFDQGAIPAEYQIVIGDSRVYIGFYTDENYQLRFTLSPNYIMSTQSVYLVTYSSLLGAIIEGAAKIKQANNYPKKPFEKTDYMNVTGPLKQGINYDPNYPYATRPNDFIQLNAEKTAYIYSMFGVNH
jgi:hypothetical protein